ncbi:MAG: aminotransferase class V-fold PLP-dependent enzyme [Peptococcaceae bacterium]|nr:aminotransferase class V-fold PLP-dependent enzyme [Peptococcaceae bacterium]
MEVYLDNAATSWPKPEKVYRAVYDFMRKVGVSSGRGAYRRALEADRIIFDVRKYLAKLFNVADAGRIIFTANVTESINLAVKGLIGPGDHVVTTSMEHNAVWRCLKVMESRERIRITAVSCSPEGRLDPGRVVESLRPDTKMIVMTHASNVTGALMPVEIIGAEARRRKICFLVDAAQTAGVYPIDVQSMNVDLLAFTGHKGLLGPQGTGGLYIREGFSPRPLKEGGTGGHSILERMPDDLPDRYEPGTPNVAGLAGLGEAVRFILNEGIDRIRRHEMELKRYTVERLERIPGMTLYGPLEPDRTVGVLSFNLGRYRPEDLAHRLDMEYGIMVRAGLHCAPCAHRTIGTIDRGTVRVGLGYFNTAGEIDYLAKALEELAGK